MNISTDFNGVSPGYNKPAGGYEWWYIDGQSADYKYKFVVIFYHINPFSTRYLQALDDESISPGIHPAVSISIYHKSNPIYYSFLEFEDHQFDWDEVEKTLNIENQELRYSVIGEKLRVEVSLNQTLPSGHRIEGTITGRGRRPSSRLIDSQSSDKHMWNLLLPSMEVQVDLDVTGKRGVEKLNFEGHGYHDHNRGEEPMKDSFKDWYWGRFHFKNFTLIYYLLQKHEEKQFEGWLIDRENQLVLEYFREADLGYVTRNWFGLKSARKIELKSAQVSVNIQCKSKIDDGPFYQRFNSDCIMNYNGKVHAAQGISEYIYPQNIYRKLFWPLVHMRLRYAYEKPNWVQKSRLMYPWTW